MRFFYRITLGLPDPHFYVPGAKEPSTLPQILNRDELVRLFTVTTNLKHRAVLMTAYAAGLRASELGRLQVSDIDSARMCLRVDQGKGSTLTFNRVLHAHAYEVADDLKVRRAEAGADRMRGFAAFAYAARSWNRERRVVARLEATARGFDARYIVTSLGGDAGHLYSMKVSTKVSTAPAARPKTSSSCTRASSPRTGPPARARSPTSSASSSTPRPIG